MLIYCTSNEVGYEWTINHAKWLKYFVFRIWSWKCSQNTCVPTAITAQKQQSKKRHSYANWKVGMLFSSEKYNISLIVNLSNSQSIWIIEISFIVFHHRYLKCINFSVFFEHWVLWCLWMWKLYFLSWTFRARKEVHFWVVIKHLLLK